MIHYREDGTFHLQGQSISYIFRRDEYGFLRHLYLGKKLPLSEDLTFTFFEEDRGFSGNFDGAKSRAVSLDTIPNEYPCAGLGDYRRPAVLIETPDGARQADFRYQSHEIVERTADEGGMPRIRGGETLCIRLSDARYGLTLKLLYTVFEDSDAIVRSAILENGSRLDVRVSKLSSFSLDLPDADYEVLRLFGRLCAEREAVWTPCAPGLNVFSSSMRGSSSHYLNPFLALRRRGTDEEKGEAIGFLLVYSGAFSLSAEYSQYGTLRVQGGIDDHDFCWLLRGGETFSVPDAIIAYSAQGVGGMSETLHTVLRKRLMSPRFAEKRRPVLLNSWEATYFDFDDVRIKKIIDLASETGMEMFVLDDGWFTNRPNDLGGLGDWEVDRNKLKGGLTDIAAYCQSKGLAFGLWFEPEMVSENSRLYAEHPEWVLKNPRSGPVRGRSQLVLDLTNPAVVEHIFRKMEGIIAECGATYIKWDMNRYLADLYSPCLPPERQREVQHRYVLGVYALAKRLTERFPNLLMEGCSGGGGRFDAGMLAYFPQIWASDNTDAYSRSIIQYGTSLCYPSCAMTAHVSACPNHQTGRTSSLEARYAVASSAVLGYELDLAGVSKEERAKIRRQIEDYKRDSALVLTGKQYRLAEQATDGFYAVMYVSSDMGMAYVAGVTGFCVANPPRKRVKLRGLDEGKMYVVEELGIEASGGALMNLGLLLPYLDRDFLPVCFHLHAVE